MDRDLPQWDFLDFSPIGGVGINLAIQEAMATANILAPIFLQRTPSETVSEVALRLSAAQIGSGGLRI
jgi:hypothetical protein